MPTPKFASVLASILPAIAYFWVIQQEILSVKAVAAILGGLVFISCFFRWMCTIEDDTLLKTALVWLAGGFLSFLTIYITDQSLWLPLAWIALVLFLLDAAYMLTCATSKT